MSVIVRGMKMPGRCGNCPCFNAENPIHCQAVKADKAKRIAAPYGLPRPDWCPLVEVPAHGRLIDADALLRDFPIRLDHYDKEHGSKHFVYGVETVMDYVSEMPTIIEAEE